ncbi:hypothetical protein SLA2020_196200 [Shorea laevis]
MAKDMEVESSVDRISALPEGVICHILSFLPTKVAVQTSVLSTKWRKIYTLVSSIDLEFGTLDDDREEIDAEKSNRFSNFVDRVFFFHDKPSIVSFRLKCYQYVDPLHVDGWIRALMQHSIQELDIDNHHFAFLGMPLPASVFSCETLVVLKVNLNSSYHALRVPARICLPNLKVLHMHDFSFSNDGSGEKLLSSCPVLEDLVLGSCAFNNDRSKFKISNSSLRRLTLQDYYTELSDQFVQIMICAPNLLLFKCTSGLRLDVILCNLSSLEDAHINVRAYAHEVYLVSYRVRVLQLLLGIQGVKSLFLSNHTIEALSYGGNLHADLPTFHNLKFLQVDWPSVEYPREFEDTIQTPKELMDILQKTPNLNYLGMREGLEPDALSQEKEILNAVPQCFLSSLKRLDIAAFDGTVTEVHFLKYLLENATVLQKMSIFCTEKLSANLEKQEEIKNELELFCADTTSCVIVFLPLE